MKAKILIVDDEKEIANLVELFLANEGYTIFKFYHPKEAIDSLEHTEYDLAILDVMMPEISGFELCKMIREKYSFPIIMLTAKVEDVDKITGLTYGADDYISKPFNPLELVARVKAQLRRYLQLNVRDTEASNIVEYRGLLMNSNTRETLLYDKKIQLTPIEFNILWHLSKNRGQVISSEELFEAVWHEKYFEANNTVMVHIRRIREKMNEDSKNLKFIKTIWGVGYIVEKE